MIKEWVLVLLLLGTFFFGLAIGIAVLGPGDYIDHGWHSEYPIAPFEDGWERRQGYCHSWRAFYSKYYKEGL